MTKNPNFTSHITSARAEWRTMFSLLNTKRLRSDWGKMVWLTFITGKQEHNSTQRRGHNAKQRPDKKHHNTNVAFKESYTS